jgi:putative endonuclease
MNGTGAHILGQVAEVLAEEYLTAHGAIVLERNYSSEHGEVDLLLLHEGDLVAVEVKARGVEDLEKPEEAIHARQLRRIVRALAGYAAQADLLENHWRVDLMAIETDANGTVQRLEHIRDIYPP